MPADRGRGAAPAGAPPNPALLKAVHACRRKVPTLADDAAWRGFLARAAGKTSLKAMTGGELGRVIDALHKLGAPKAAGSGAGRPARLLDSRPQARMARGIWIEMGKAGLVRDRSESALDSFCFRVTGKSSLTFCGAAELNKVLEAVKDMLRRGKAAAEDRNLPAAEITLPEPEPEGSETRTQAMVRALWRALIDAGAMRTGIFADMEVWLVKRTGQRHPEYLTEVQAESAVAHLTAWLRRHRNGETA